MASILNYLGVYQSIRIDSFEKYQERGSPETHSDYLGRQQEVGEQEVDRAGDRAH